jgi:hypothetical protein
MQSWNRTVAPWKHKVQAFLGFPGSPAGQQCLSGDGFRRRRSRQITGTKYKRKAISQSMKIGEILSQNCRSSLCLRLSDITRLNPHCKKQDSNPLVKNPQSHCKTVVGITNFTAYKNLNVETQHCCVSLLIRNRLHLDGAKVRVATFSAGGAATG